MSRRGLTLVELLVALVLGGVVLAAAGGMLVRHVRALEELAGRVEAEEVGRTTFHLLGGEIRAGRFGRDWSVGDEEHVLSLRSFQGLGRVCRWDSAEREATVAYAGWGTLESERDSVLVLPAEGGWQAVGVERLGSGSAEECPEDGGVDGPVEVWRLDASMKRPLLVRPFRSTAYHLADEALRVEHGGAGRQPLTPGRLAHGSFAVTEDGDLLLEADLDVEPFGPPRGVSWTLRALPSLSPTREGPP